MDSWGARKDARRRLPLLPLLLPLVFFPLVSRDPLPRLAATDCWVKEPPRGVPFLLLPLPPPLRGVPPPGRPKLEPRGEESLFWKEDPLLVGDAFLSADL
jgi:hypothetical protein